MKAIVLDEPGRLRHDVMEAPRAPGPDEALIRIRQLGVCGTDLHAFRGEQPFFTYPRILGHELGTEVVAVGAAVRGLHVGDRCAVEPYFNCGHCPACRRGKPNCCLNLKVFGVHIDGGMRDFALVPSGKLHRAPTLSFEQLALVEPLAIGAHAVARAQLQAGESVLVVGAGPIGLAVVQFALLAGVTVLVLELSAQRRAFVARQWPAVTLIDASDDPTGALRDLAGDDLPTAVFDATGNPHSMRAAFNYVGHGGRLIFVGLVQGDVAFHDPDFHRRELTILGSRNAMAADFRHIIGALEQGHIDLSTWITHRTTSEELIDEFPRWFERDSGLVKALVAF